MGKKKQKSTKAIISRQIGSACVLFAGLAFAVYLFSPYTKVQALICSGNYYYTPQQVFSIANLNVNTRTFLHPVGKIEKALEDNPLIKSADVTMDGQNIKINIQEKDIIGYYEKDGSNYLVTSTKERIPVENETELRTLIHFPMLVDLSDETIDAIADQVAAHPEQLNRQVFEKIAEILPWSESYDKNMLKLVLQDGNTAFTSISSLPMMTTYQQVLTDLQGQDVCLLLDGEHSVVNKIACDYMYLSQEERAGSREIPKSVLTYQPGQTSPSPADSTPPQREKEPLTAPQGPEIPPNYVPPVDSDPGPVVDPANRAAISDWEPSALPEMQYSPSADIFHSLEDGLYYTYDPSSDEFTALE